MRGKNCVWGCGAGKSVTSTTYCFWQIIHSLEIFIQVLNCSCNICFHQLTLRTTVTPADIIKKVQITKRLLNQNSLRLSSNTILNHWSPATPPYPQPHPPPTTKIVKLLSASLESTALIQLTPTITISVPRHSMFVFRLFTCTHIVALHAYS